jgi:hypothetical protein
VASATSDVTICKSRALLMASEGRRLAALRDGFGRALEGATGACGFEARACCALSVRPKRASRAVRAARRSSRRATRTSRRPTTPPCSTSTARRGRDTARAARRTHPAETQLSLAPRAVCAAAARHDAGARRRSASHERTARASPRECARRGCAAAETLHFARPQSDFDAVCVEGRLGAWLDELDALCAARGVGGMGVDAPATRCAPAAARAFKRAIGAPFSEICTSQAGAAWRARAGGRRPRRALRCQGG